MRSPASGVGLRLVAKVLLGFLLGLHALAGSAAAPAGAPRESIRVVMDDDYPPYIFRAPDGALKGILVDQWALWEQKTGIRVRLEAMNWDEAQRRMQGGDYDVIDTIFRTQARQALYDFTPPYARLDVPLFFSKDLSGIRGPKDLGGFIVGAKKGDTSIEILKAGGVSHFLLFDNYEEIVAAARDGKVKVFTVDQPPALYYLIKMGIQDQFRQSEPLYSGEFHRAVHRGDSALLATVLRGFDAIPKSEYQAIDRRWFGAPLFTRRDLRFTAAIAGGFVGLVALLLFWVWTLGRMVARRTEELRTSHAYTQALFHSVHDAVFVEDGQGRILDFNARAVELFGYERPEMLAFTMADLSQEGPPQSLAEFQARLASAAAEGQALFEWGGRRAGGGVFPLEVAVRVDRSGAPPRFIIAVRDITERKRIEAALFASELVTKTISRNFTNGMFYQVRVEPGGRRTFTYLSESVTLLYGVSVEAAMADSSLIYGRIHPEDIAALTQAEEEVLVSLTTFKMEARVVGPQGQVRWSSFVSTPRRMPDGSTFWEGVEFIITDRKLAEEALLESEAQNRSLISAIPDLIFTLDRSGEYLAVHASRPDLLLLPADRLLHRKLRDIMQGPLVQQYDKAIGDALDLNAVQELTYSLELPGGVKCFEARFAPCANQQVIAIVRDVSESRRIEEQQRDLQAQLQRAQKMESLGSLAGGVAHDMNNVLGAILAIASSNLEGGTAGSPLYRAFDTIAKAATRGGQMVKSLLNFARQTPMDDLEVDLNGVIRDVAQLLERTTLSKIRLERDLAPGLRTIRGDAGSLAHALMNLCVNAVDAMPSDGTLSLRTVNLDDGQVQVLVEDTGSGMPPDVLRKALDPFFTTKGVGKGTGLGLSMVYGIVKAHKGHLDIQSQVGQGTRVVLRFPASAAPPAAVAGGEPGTAASQRPLQVLLVDDDEFLRSSVQGLLDLLGHTTVVASSGEEALLRLEAGFRPDVVMLDMNMPGLGGNGTLPPLRVLLPALPVILVTGKADQVALDFVHAHAHVTLLAKPFTLGELRRHLEPLAGKS